MRRKRQRQRWCVPIVAIILFLTLFSSVLSAKTVFAADRGDSQVDIFHVADDLAISHTAMLNFTAPDDTNQNRKYGLGPIDFAMDERNQIVFVSFETVSSSGLKVGQCKIALIDFNTLTHIKDIDLPQANDFGGLCYDAQRQRLYAIERNSNLLYILKWYPESLSLKFERIIELDQITYACAIVVHEDMAYITEYRYSPSMLYYNHIKQYDISSDWAYVQTIDNGQASTCLAYDSQRMIFYSGAYDYGGTYHHVIKHTLLPDSLLVRQIGSADGCMIDGDIDEQTGYLYLTSYRKDVETQLLYGTIEIWDTSGWTSDPNQTIMPLATYNNAAELKGPAGILRTARDPKGVLIGITKEDGLDPHDPNACVLPNSLFTYTITVDPNQTSHTNVVVVDSLPEGVEFDSAIPDTGVYSPRPDHTYTWDLGTVSSVVQLQLKVRVNEKAEPNGRLVNEVTVESDMGFARAFEQTPVCCWGGDVIYVDASKPDGGNGTSWAKAYKNLQDAMARAAKGCGNQVWIAKGTYKPGIDETVSFVVPDNVSVYGGFAGNETAVSQRNIPANPTILSGYIRTLNDIEYRNEKVVVMGDETLLDGVIVEKAKKDGISGNDSDYTIRNCKSRENGEYGISCRNGTLIVDQSMVYSNNYDGIFHYGGSCNVQVENCIISNNKRNGVGIWYSKSTILNSVIGQNGLDSTESILYYGVYLFKPTMQAVLRNNTIVWNQNAGVFYEKNTVSIPDPKVKNCIIWHNAENDRFTDIVGFSQTIRCCLTDPNDVMGIHTQTDARGNIHSCPKFAYPDPALHNYHLAYDSPCKDAGDPNETGANEVDLDKQDRVAGNSIEMGADEIGCDDVYNACDWNADGVVNFTEYFMLSHAWLTVGSNDPNLNDPNYNSVCDLNHDWSVDEDDLAIFTPNWLWIACWRYDLQQMMQQQSMMSMSIPEFSLQSNTLAEESISMDSAAPKIEPPKKSVEQRVLELQDAAKWLEELWLNELEVRQTIDEKSWNEFMQSVYENLDDLKRIKEKQTLNETEVLQ